MFWGNTSYCVKWDVGKFFSIFTARRTCNAMNAHAYHMRYFHAKQCLTLSHHSSKVIFRLQAFLKCYLLYKLVQQLTNFQLILRIVLSFFNSQISCVVNFFLNFNSRIKHTPEKVQVILFSSHLLNSITC